MRTTSIGLVFKSIAISAAACSTALSEGCTSSRVAPHSGAPPAAATTAQPAESSAASFEVVSQLAPCIFHTFQDSRGTYWFSGNFGEGSGLYRWSGKTNTFDHFTTKSGLPDNGVGKVQEDRFGNLYFCTYTGIAKFDGRSFTTLKLDDAEPAATEVKLGPDVLWFTAGGEQPQAVFYDGTSLRRLKIPTTGAGDAHYARLPRAKYPNAKYSPYDAYTFYTDRRGNLWFGTASLGACRFDGKTFAWISQEELDFNEKNGRSFGTRSIIEDRDGKIWITNTRNRFDMNPAPSVSATEGAGGIRYVKLPGLAHRADGEDEHYTFIMSMAKDKAGDLWMATYGAGVWRYNGKDLKNYPVIVDGKPITVFSIYCDREGDLWLGTHEHGVCRFNGESFEKFRL